jgi:hypothetical protein
LFPGEELRKEKKVGRKLSDPKEWKSFFYKKISVSAISNIWKTMPIGSGERQVKQVFAGRSVSFSEISSVSAEEIRMDDHLRNFPCLYCFIYEFPELPSAC